METELRTLWAALAVYVIAGCLAVIGTILRRRPEKVLLGLMAAGLGLHALAIGLRWGRLGYGPFITMFDILSSNIFSLLFIFTLAYWRFRPIRPVAAVVLPVMFLMMGWLIVVDPAEGRYPPTYDTIWLYIHIGFGKVFLGAALVALGMAIVILARWAGVFGFASLPDSESLDELAYRFMAIGFIFDALMLVAGAVWAQDAWGRYWAWDPLETWSLITWLLLALALHTKVTLKTAPPVGAVMVIVVFAVAFLTFFGVPFISEAPHKGVV